MTQNHKQLHTPGLATAEVEGVRMVRRRARRFYPEGERGSGAAEQDAGVEAVRPEEAFNEAAGGD